MLEVVLLGIYLETKFRNRDLMIVWAALYVFVVPVMTAALMTRYRKKIVTTLEYMLPFTICAVSLYLVIAVIAGIVALVCLIFGVTSKYYLYVIYVVVLYPYTVLSIAYGEHEVDDPTKGFEPKTTKGTWMFILEIHLLSRYIFNSPERQSILWILLTILITQIPIFFDVLREESRGSGISMYIKGGKKIKDRGKHIDLCIPVVRGASSEKTCFIHQSIGRNWTSRIETPAVL